MSDMKQRILAESLALFAENGYSATPVSAIASRLGAAKSALYKHYRNKREIFTCIVAQMEAQDAARSAAFSVPEALFQDAPESYRHTERSDLAAYAYAQFCYWCEDPFAAAFRKLLTLEQFRSPEMASLYQQYLAGGVVDYLTDLFREMPGENGAPPADPAQTALQFYAPLFLLYSEFDAAADKAAVLQKAKRHIDTFWDTRKERI